MLHAAAASTTYSCVYCSCMELRAALVQFVECLCDQSNRVRSHIKYTGLLWGN